MPRMPVVSIAALVTFAVLPDNPLDCLLQRLVTVFCGQRQHIPPVSKQIIAHFPVDLKALWNCHAQAGEQN